MAEVPYIAVAAYGMPVEIDGERCWVEAESGNNCSDGFPALEPFVAFSEHQVGEAVVRAISARVLVDTARALLERDPGALLCRREGCVACDAARATLP
jgi:hypothetical protein